ncbi:MULTISPECIES: hypothetical protein [unclassified Phenylobacterium]|uniref:hypothetical protein n=1 Tax=unclassified Phenylobacterium TaxID=2640670 RepID=UPI000ABC889B|nr:MULTISPECIES: hypothetical protein [unclassified Phenylobacterium]
MKHLAIAVAAATVAAAAGLPAHAQRWITINERQARLDDRIDAGLRSGQLTRNEAERLRGEFREIARLETSFRYDGLSTRERTELDRRFDALSREIRDERQDRQTARGWFGGPGWTDTSGAWMNINMRQRELDRRIDAGVRRGDLTDAEARRLRDGFREIARLEARYRRGGLTYRERADLDRRFDALAVGIQWQSTDRQVGEGYGRRR